MGIPHFLAIPFPVLGHINPLTQLSNVLAKHYGCKVTFLNSEFNHKRAKIDDHDEESSSKMIKFVTLPDGLDHEDDRSDLSKVLHSIKSTMPSLLPKLIQDINALDFENKITCILVTVNMGWALEIGHQLGIKGAAFSPFSATSLASIHFIPKLMEDGIIDSDGNPIKSQEIQIAPNMPKMNPKHVLWCNLGNEFFKHLVQEMKTMELLAEWCLCNSAYDLEPGALSISPRFLSIGPLMESDNNNNNKSSSFWQEDTTCLEWLDQQQPQSVVYVSFGSLAVLESNQFKELALALDLIDKPFLWVVRPGINDDKNNAFPNEFHGNKGKIVSWVSQKKILQHAAISCFISHCGWNSTIEGVYSGVSFLCWPFFIDQFWNKSYICDVWKVGMELVKDENGFISKEEIRKKVEQLLGDEGIRERSSKLKEVTRKNLGEGGQSSKNLEKFVNWAK
ncbi:UDP-glycosyltransferase 83A1 [Arachis hypogaea]|uniref:UDP-glycosyltransferase 83A1 n=1 Tax=Arachis hypogaea TaxID=3818 RepID=UPI000DEC9D97|nr:UDP-glycosyltransferase 83A1 isoform X1 [Arachis hypogaea]QHO09252.1 UDP-glycosyltransferase [Arachis hypogaea]